MAATAEATIKGIVSTGMAAKIMRGIVMITVMSGVVADSGRISRISNVDEGISSSC
jgi:hypothetical protein